MTVLMLATLTSINESYCYWNILKTSFFSAYKEILPQRKLQNNLAMEIMLLLDNYIRFFLNFKIL